MKRIIALTLALLMFISMVSCGGTENITETETAENKEEKQEKTTEDKGVHIADGVFAVGFGREDITPDTPGAGLGGYDNSSTRLSTKTLDRISVTAVAMRDSAGNLSIICTVDNCNLPGSSYCTPMRKLFADKYNIPTSSILIAATHSHSCPSISDSVNPIWTSQLTKKTVSAITNAVEDLDKAEIYQGTVEIPDMNYIRRYQLADGTWKTNPTSADKPVKHESESDKTLQVIKFDRENQKDVIIVNWGAHPCFTGGESKTDVSADYPGVMRTKVEKDTGALCAFWQAAGGNLVTSGKLAGESKKYTTNDEYGKQLAKYVEQALENPTKVEAGEVKSVSRTVEAVVDHSRDGEYSVAKPIASALASGQMAKAKELAKDTGLTVYEARDIVNKHDKGKSQDIEISAIKVGGIAFIAAPYEMFDTNGMEIKKNSPFDMTFVCELANNRYSYFPSAAAFPHGGYEVNSFYYVKGTSEDMAKNFIEMLKELNG